MTLARSLFSLSRGCLICPVGLEGPLSLSCGGTCGCEHPLKRLKGAINIHFRGTFRKSEAGDAQCSCLASVSFLRRDAKPPPPSRAVAAPLPLPPLVRAGGIRVTGRGAWGERDAAHGAWNRGPGLTGGRLFLLHLRPRPPPPPAPRDAVWSPDAPPGGAHGPPGLPVHGQPRRATRPGPRGHGARPQASSAPARPEPGPEPGPAGAHRPRAEPQVSGAQRGGGGPRDPRDGVGEERD